MPDAAYPVDLDIAPAARQSRLTALLRPAIALPLAIIAILLIWPAQLVVAILAATVILLSERMPRPLFRLSVNLTRLFVNITTYVFSLRDEYPPLSWRDGTYPVAFDVYERDRWSRTDVALKLGGWVFFYAWFLLYFVSWAWIAPWATGFLGVLFAGRFPPRARRIVVAVFRLHVQTYCFMAFMTQGTNPFSLRRPEGWASRFPESDTSVGGAQQRGQAPTAAGARMPDTEIPFDVQAPRDLPTFADVGGMGRVKADLNETIGLLLAFPEMAEQYGVRWNGVLLYGPPGTGKTFLAQATAGEFALNFISVGAGELLSAYRGRSAQRVVQAFETAQKNLPCLLFFDEFDSLALKRGSTPLVEERNTVNQLLRSLERFRRVPDLIVMAATNDPNHLDDAVVRPGRFDRRIRIDLPDRVAREEIIRTLLAKRPAPHVDIPHIANALDGSSPATIRRIIDAASLSAMRSVAGGGDGEITTASLITAIRAHGGQDRPARDDWSWDQLVLADKTKDELKEFEKFIEDPDLPDKYGIDAPSGLLLYGPPGTGKTTIAKVLAAEARASFYAISPADLMSKWVGETEENIAETFQRARENRPSIIFFDEIDALFPKRGMMASFDDRWTNQLLQEIDGMRDQRGIFVLGATNRRESLDEALLRGGRLSRQIEIPLPDAGCRRRLLALVTRRMPLRNVDLDALALQTEGFSGADLKALAQDAALKAALRANGGLHGPVHVTHADFLASTNDFIAQKRRVS